MADNRLDRAFSSLFDLIISDIEMPNLDGYTFVKYCRNCWRISLFQAGE